MNNYDLLQLLGSGSYGKVYKALRKSDNQIIALKIIDITDNTKQINNKQINTIKSEIDYLKTLSIPKCQNEFVICYYDSFYDSENKQYLIEMELIDGIEVDKFIKARPKSREERYHYLLLVALDISRGLNYIHSKNIIHNDIKPANIMIQKGTFIPKIIDFGLSCVGIDDEEIGNYCVKNVGTPLYLAPEFFEPHGFKNPASDMWALGVMLYKMASGSYPFMAPDRKQVLDKIRNADTTYQNINTTNQLLNQVINGLLVANDTKRLTSSQVIKLINNNKIN